MDFPSRCYRALFKCVWVAGDISGSRVLIDGVRVVGPRQAAVANPSGGTTIDIQARAALSSLLASMRAHGLIAP